MGMFPLLLFSRALKILVMAGLVPAIHVLRQADAKTWMPGTSPGMTK